MTEIHWRFFRIVWPVCSGSSVRFSMLEAHLAVCARVFRGHVSDSVFWQVSGTLRRLFRVQLHFLQGATARNHRCESTDHVSFSLGCVSVSVQSERSSGSQISWWMSRLEGQTLWKEHLFKAIQYLSKSTLSFPLLPIVAFNKESYL